MRIETSRRGGVFVLLFATSLLCAGCGGKGEGDTVPSPPRELVEKSFHPSTSGVQTGARGANAATSSPTPAGK